MTTAVYLRTSSELQADNHGVESQRFELQCLFAGRGIDYGTAIEFVDDGISGATEDRPAFQRLKAAIERCEIRTLYVFDMDRIARDVDIRSAFVRLCIASGCQIIELAGEVNTSTPIGMLLERIKSALAEFQRSQIAARTKAGVQSRLAQGERWGGARVVRKNTRRGKKSLGCRRFSDEEEQQIAWTPGRPHTVAKQHGLANGTTVVKYRKKWGSSAPTPAPTG